MKKSYLLVGSVILIVLCYLGSLIFSFPFYSLIKIIAAGLSIMAIVFFRSFVKW